jgi:hypothetical protein
MFGFAGGGAVVNTTVAIRRLSDNGILAVATSDAAGNFGFTVTTNGLPLGAYLTLDSAGYLPTRVYLAKPLTSDIQLGNLTLATQATITSVGQANGVQLQPNDSALLLMALDCSLVRVPGATFAAAQVGNLVGNLVNIDSTTSLDLNVPPGSISVTAELNGMNIGPSQALAISGGLTITLLSM